jgi:hypothetical protein
VFRFLLWAILAALKPKALVVAENLCLRHQLLVLQRRQPRPYLKTTDRLFWVLASRWLGGWRNLLLIVKPQTVLNWHRRGLAPLLVVAITDEAAFHQSTCDGESQRSCEPPRPWRASCLASWRQPGPTA